MPADAHVLSRVLGGFVMEPLGAAPGGRGTDALPAEERLLVAAATRIVAKPLTVAAVSQRADLIAREADEVALANEPFVAEPGERLGLGAIGPLGDQPAGGGRSGRRCLDGDDTRDDWIAHDATVALALPWIAQRLMQSSAADRTLARRRDVVEDRP